MAINLHLARIFFTVVQEHSFSRAADHLHVSQSAVSKGVKELENQLGISLIDRGGRSSRAGVILTESGQTLYAHLQGIFALERAAIEDLHARLGLRQGELVIGASTTVAAYWLPPLLAQFQRQHPDIRLTVHVGNTHAISEGLLACQVDMAVVEGEIDDPGIMAEVWQEEPLLIVDAYRTDMPDTAQTAQTLSQRVWLIREAGSGTGVAAQHILQEQGIQPRQTIEFGSNEGIARAVSAGMGLALLPGSLVKDLVKLRQLTVIPFTCHLTRPLFYLRRAKRPLSPAAQAFAALLESPSAVA